MDALNTFEVNFKPRNSLFLFPKYYIIRKGFPSRDEKGFQRNFNIPRE
jgi:hypothetical protein